MSQLSILAREFMQETHIAVLGTINRDGTPQQSAIWYLLDGNEIVMNTLRGRRKDRNMRRDPRVSVCVAQGYQYVAVTGSAVLIDDPVVAQQDMRFLTVRYRGEEAGDRQYRDVFAQQERVTIRVPITQVDEYGM